eukprot:820707-Amphidinium_carterae.1
MKGYMFCVEVLRTDLNYSYMLWGLGHYLAILEAVIDGELVASRCLRPVVAQEACLNEGMIAQG